MPLPVPGRMGEALRRSTVAVHSGRSGIGSGVALHSDLVVTNAHVVSRGELLVESWEGKRLRARLIKIDHGRDLALLETSGLRANAAELGDSDLVRPGTPVIAVGNPLGFTGATSSGVIHSKVNGGAYRWLCADVRLAPGNSGGPMATFSGQVVGINTMVIAGGLALAAPSRSVQAFMAADAERRRIGVTVRPVSSGLLILELAAGGPAEAASLLQGDLLLTANDQQLRSAEDLQIASHGAELLEVTFLRGGEARVRRVVIRLLRGRSATAA